MNDLERAGHVYCPDARYDTKRIDIHDSDGRKIDYVLLIRVYYRLTRKVVRTVKGKAYVRLGSSKKELNEDEIRELEIDSGEVEFEQELTNYPYPTAFHLDLIEQFCRNFREDRAGRLREDITNEEILELRHLGKFQTGKFMPNIACVLVFAQDPQERFPGCKIRFLRFEGEIEGTGDKWRPVKDVKIDSGPIALQIVEAERLLESQLRTFTHLTAGTRFDTLPEYPKTAWYEALVNACVHRSYNLKNMNIFIRMFDDRLEIESPGGFPALVTPENIYYTEHPRNPFLFDAMFYLRFVRAAREGARRIRDSMQEWALPRPEFSQRESGYPFVRVTLRNDYKQRKVLLDSAGVAFLGLGLFNTLTQEERRAVNYAAEHGKVKPSDLMRLLQVNWHHCKRVLARLKAKDIFAEKRRKDIARDSQSYFYLKRPKGNGETGGK